MITEAQKKAIEKYQASPKGKAALKRAQRAYNQSRKGRAARRRYLQTCKGREAVAASRRTRQLLTQRCNP